MKLRAGVYALAALALLAPRPCAAQERGATALGDALAGLPVSVRVLVIGAHPDDEDNRLLTYLAKGRHADVAYLSLTRGDGGQNLIGNELGEALGVIRTEELLAARRVDGAQQYFTRAYDFGFSKSAAESFKHWPHDTLLTDVVTVVRAFRPQIIIAVFSGTPRDGHGHHQVSGILAREAYDLAGDGTKFPASATKGLAPWTPLKFYRTTSYWSGAGATFHYDAGEYSPLLGRSYAEIAAESRSQHQSQGQGALQRKGYIAGSVKREDSRASGAPKDASTERSIFDGVDTTYRRLRGEVGAAQRSRVDSLVKTLAKLDLRYDPMRPDTLLPELYRASRLARALASSASGDVQASLVTLQGALARAEMMASGVAIEATVPREALALGDSMSATVTVYNRRPGPEDAPMVLVIDSVTLGGSAISVSSSPIRKKIAPDSSATWSLTARASALTAPWWLTPPRTTDLFASQVSTESAEATESGESFANIYTAAGVYRSPLVLRVANLARGEEERPLAIVPAISVTLDGAVAYARANAPLDREVRVTLRSAFVTARDATVRLELPHGLDADTLARTVSLDGMGAEQTVVFRVRGTLPAGRHVITAVAKSGSQKFESGYVAIRYDHIRPQTIVRAATMAIEAVEVQLPHGVNVAYVQGVGDNSAPMLAELGVPVTLLDAHGLAAADLSRFTTVV
ncbi:MAG: PIG-L family deacetylase, partial [Gemmatimonadota bacterium]|nr:PIG-L family deacetylase [Gemmatimonadota bacterium]